MRVFVSDCIFSGVEVKIFIDFREYARACERAVALLIGCYLTRQKMAIQIDGLSSCHIIQDFFQRQTNIFSFYYRPPVGSQGKNRVIKKCIRYTSLHVLFANKLYKCMICFK